MTAGEWCDLIKKWLQYHIVVHHIANFHQQARIQLFCPPLRIPSAIMGFHHLDLLKIKSSNYKLSNEPSVVIQLFSCKKLLAIFYGALFTVILAEIKYTL